jgi:hypothetical protein
MSAENPMSAEKPMNVSQRLSLDRTIIPWIRLSRRLL